MSAELPSFSVASRPTGAFAPVASDAMDRKSSCKTGLPRNKSGFTLMEVMMAAMVFAMASVGIYSMLFKAYQLAALSRYHDDARAVLQTFADQFERIAVSDIIYTDGSNNVVTFPSTDIYQDSTKNVVNATTGAIVYSNISKGSTPRELFALTTATGNGLQYWDTTNHEVLTSNQKSSDTAVLNWHANDPLSITLGSNLSTSPSDVKAISATITRAVVQINNASGAVNSTATTTVPAAGQLLQATFTITYTVYGQIVTQSVSVMRLSS